MLEYEIIHRDPTQLSYLSKHLREDWCTIIEKQSEGQRQYYLRSTDFDVLEATGTLGPDSSGLSSIIFLLSSDNWPHTTIEEKLELCFEGIMAIIDGTSKVKYGLKVDNDIAQSRVRYGIKASIDDRGQEIKTVRKDIVVRASLTLPYQYFEDADKENPTGVEIVRLARNNPPIANALYFYAYADWDDTVNLNKVYEQLERGIGQSKFRSWVQKLLVQNNFVQNRKEAASKRDALEEWLNNPYLSGKKARHSPREKDKETAERLKANNTSIGQQEAANFIRMLLINRIKELTEANTDSVRAISEPYMAIPNVEYGTQILQIHLTEEPLTAHNLAIIISSLTELHTKLFLIEQGRFTDLTEYSQKGNPQFDEEAALIITRLTHNSPTWIDLVSVVLSASGGIAVLKLLIDAVI